jgi:cytochrome c
MTRRCASGHSDAAPSVITLPAPLNAVAVAPDGEIVIAGADGKVTMLSPTGELRGELEAAQAPVIALALSNDGKRIAAAGIRGSVSSTGTRSISAHRPGSRI